MSMGDDLKSDPLALTVYQRRALAYIRKHGRVSDRDAAKEGYHAKTLGVLERHGLVTGRLREHATLGIVYTEYTPTDAEN